MAKGKGKYDKSIARKEKYKRQRIRTEANKARRRRKHLEEHPNDLVAQKALKGKV